MRMNIRFVFSAKKCSVKDTDTIQRVVKLGNVQLPVMNAYFIANTGNGRTLIRPNQGTVAGTIDPRKIERVSGGIPNRSQSDYTGDSTIKKREIHSGSNR